VKSQHLSPPAAERFPMLHALALLSFVALALCYGLILGPVSVAFNTPLHTNAVTGMGKAIMRTIGVVQPIVAIAAFLLIAISLLLKGRIRRLVLDSALVLLVYVVLDMILQMLMLLSWVVTLWQFSEAEANQMALANETTLWSFVDWRVQMLLGVVLGAGVTSVAVVAVWHALTNVARRRTRKQP
jgi:presenilin-like A22 family membrane protease